MLLRNDTESLYVSKLLFEDYYVSWMQQRMEGGHSSRGNGAIALFSFADYLQNREFIIVKVKEFESSKVDMVKQHLRT